MEAEKICSFKEPVNGIECELWMIPYNQLENSKYQRSFSKPLVNKIAASVVKGFFIPLLVVNEDGKWKNIDGQHRYGSLMKVAGAVLVPCIVVPDRFKFYTLLYNIEKSDGLKDRCMKAYELYCDFVDIYPELTEDGLRDYVVGDPHLITLAFAYMESNLKSPSLIETSIKKFDHFLGDVKLPACVETRQHRGELAAVLEKTVYNVADTFGVTDYVLKQAIISKTNSQLWGRKRNVDLPFDEAIDSMVEFISEKDWGFLGR